MTYLPPDKVAVGQCWSVAGQIRGKQERNKHVCQIAAVNQAKAGAGYFS